MGIRIDRLRCHATRFLLVFVGALAPIAATGQEPIVPLHLSFSDPGARSMGFGGAFVALADDATASLANPAGLVQLVKPEISIEGRYWAYSTPFTENGRVEGLPSGFGIDTVAGLRTSRSEDEVTGLSFLSIAYPKGKWTVAFFRHQLADFEFHSATQGLFGGGSNCCQVRIFDQQANTDMKVASYGISGGYEVSERLALGVGVVYHDVSLDSEATMFLPDGDLPEGFFGATSYLPERSLVRERNFSHDSDLSLVGGFLWRLSSTWTLGGVYREGPEVELGVERTAGEAGDSGVPPGGVLARFSGIPVELPGVVGLGFAYRAPSGRLTLTSQWDRIDYSAIVESLQLDDRAIDDVEELHLGVEYVFLESQPVIALRAGAWLDPDHQIRSTAEDPILSGLLPPGDDELHYTAGLGLAFPDFQIDLGVDMADRLDAVSISMIYTF